MLTYKIHKFPRSRIATIDVCGIGMRKHHIAAMIELDVTGSREKIKRYKKESKLTHNIETGDSLDWSFRNFSLE